MSDRQLIADLLSALEYHTEQTRPIEFSRTAIEAAREYLRHPAQSTADDSSRTRKPWVGLTDDEANELWESTDSDWELMKRTEAKLKGKNNG